MISSSVGGYQWGGGAATVAVHPWCRCVAQCTRVAYGGPCLSTDITGVLNVQLWRSLYVPMWQPVCACTRVYLDGHGVAWLGLWRVLGVPVDAATRVACSDGPVRCVYSQEDQEGSQEGVAHGVSVAWPADAS